MRIAFADLLPYNYRVESAYQEPLGGTQSALCYLAEALAQRGHEVFLFTDAPDITLSLGVICLPLKLISKNFFPVLNLDALILQSLASEGKNIRPMLQPQTKLLFWAQHAHDQPGVASLAQPGTHTAFDFMAMVSDWQRNSFMQEFGIPAEKLKVMRNAIAPCFEHLFAPEQSVMAGKPSPPVLAYTSTPFRGLDVLLEVFPHIRQAVPGTCLKVFSSMKVYQVPAEQDQFQHLYDLCQELDGVEYIGSLPQPQLARQLRSVTALTYPNYFPETSCIAVMEAMASGCLILTTDLAALPETTAGFAHLVPVPGNDEVEAYKTDFVSTTVAALRQSLNQSRTIEQHLQAQVNYINQHCTWKERARQWEEWLNEICNPPIVAGVEPAIDWQQQVRQFWLEGEYQPAIALYEEKIAAEPEQVYYYWNWGVLLILAGREEEAQLGWSMILSEADTELSQKWTADLILTLQQEAERQELLGEFAIATRLRQYIQEFSPDNLSV